MENRSCCWGRLWLGSLHTGVPVSGLNSAFAGMNKDCYLRHLNLCTLSRKLYFFFLNIPIRSWLASQPFTPSQPPRGWAVGFFFLQLWSTLSLAHCLEAAAYNFWFVSVQFFLLFYNFYISIEISVLFLAPFPFPPPQALFTLVFLLAFCLS